mgnify:CR=1 FL=1
MKDKASMKAVINAAEMALEYSLKPLICLFSQMIFVGSEAGMK